MIETRITRDLLRDRVASVLRQMIVSGELPEETRIVENQLADRLGISRTPLREALALLDREGLVRYCPGKATIVRGFGEDELRDLFGVRTVLEAYAAELAAGRVQDEEIADLNRTAEAMSAAVPRHDIEAFVGNDFEIHRGIWRASGSQRLLAILEDLASPVRAFLEYNARHLMDWADLAERHRSLIQAIASRDGEFAAGVVRREFRKSLDEALAISRSLVPNSGNGQELAMGRATGQASNRPV